MTDFEEACKTMDNEEKMKIRLIGQASIIIVAGFVVVLLVVVGFVVWVLTR